MSDLMLYPDEEIRIREVYTTLSKKFVGKIDTKENLVAFATEATNRFKEAGFVINVDISTVDLVDDKVVFSPTIEILDRVEHEENHDYEKHSVQVQSGLADGVVGAMGEDGRLHEPSKLWTPGSSFRKDS